MTFKRFFLHLLAMALLLLLVFGVVLMWLKMYTNHGQKIELRDYVGKNYEKAAQHAEKQSFELIVKDSVHRVGQPGGIILSQNPEGGARVKENRKIYVDITKYNADELDLKDLSVMYGNPYSSIQTRLGYLDISTEIKGYKQDPGEENYILEVWYNGRMIAGENGRKNGVKIQKGGTLGFVLTENRGEVEIPDLICRQYGQLAFLLPNWKLKLGAIEFADGAAITNKDEAYIISQKPAFVKGQKIPMGTMLEVTIQQEEPESCKEL